VGILADRLNGLESGVLMAPHRAQAIEADALRRLGLAEGNEALARLTLVGRTVAGGRRRVEVVEIARTGDAGAPAMYGVKTAHGSEPDSAVLASDVGAGPTVLDVSDGVITETYFPEATNLRQRRFEPGDYDALGRAMARLLVALARPEAGDLICHKDEKPEHLFVLGRGTGLRVRLIDWGRADRWPMDRFDEWFAEQGVWLYTYLSQGQPAVWRPFAAALTDAASGAIGADRLARGYLALVAALTAPLADPMRRRFALGFLEFSVRCGPVPLNLGWFNRFVADAAETRGEGVAQAFEDARDQGSQAAPPADHTIRNQRT